jgi:hypothetical protein
VSLVRNGMPWFVVALLTDAAEQAMPDGVVEGQAPAAVGAIGRRRRSAKSAKWLAQRARVALKLGGDAERSSTRARWRWRATDSPMAWTVGVFRVGRLLSAAVWSRDAVLPPDERRSLTATFQRWPTAPDRRGDEAMRARLSATLRAFRRRSFSATPSRCWRRATAPFCA